MAAESFEIARGHISIETRVDGDKLGRQARTIGDRSGNTLGDRMGKSFSKRFSRTSLNDSDRKSWFKRTFQNGLFKNDPELMRGLLHPIESFFSRPIAAMFASTLLPALLGTLSSVLSSAVLLALGGGIVAAGALLLVGNEKITKKLADANLTRVRKASTLELANLRTTLREKLTSMKASGASEEDIRAVRIAGEEHIANVALANQKKIAAASKATSTSVTDMFVKNGKKILDSLTRAAQPLIGPLTKGAEALARLFMRLEPQFKRIFAAAAPIIPLLVDTFVEFAEQILPAIQQSMPAVVKMFEVLALHAPDLTDAMVQLLLAMADKSTITAFGILLTGLAGTLTALAYIIPSLNNAFIATFRIWEAEIHFFQKVPGYIRAAWTNLSNWFNNVAETVKGAWNAVQDWSKMVIGNIVGYFHTLRDRAGRTVDETAKVFRELPGKVMHWIQGLPGAFARSLEAAMEGGIFIVGWGLGKIVDFFVRLPGRVISQVDALWEGMKRAVAMGIVATVSFFATLPARISSWWTRTWKSVLDVTTSWLVKIVDFISNLPSRVDKWFEKTWQTAQDTTKRWFNNITSFISNLPDRAATALLNLGPKIVKRFTDSWSGAQKTSNSWITKILGVVLGVPVLVWKNLVKLKDRLVNRFAEGWSAATGQSKTKVAGIINFVLGIPGRIFNALRALAGLLVQRVRTAWSEFQKSLGRGVAATIVYVTQIPGRISRGIGKLGSLLFQKGRDVLQGLLVGVQARIREIGGLGSWFKSNLVDPVVGAVKRFFQIGSPSRVFHGIGMDIVAGLWKGVASHNPVKMIDKIFGGMPQALGAMIQKGLINVQNLPQKALGALGKLWGAIGDMFGGGGRGGPGTGGTIGFAAQAWRMLQAAFGFPMGGWRAHGSVPGSDHPKGKAIDVMTSSPAAHEMIIAFARAMLPGLKYWISNRQIASADHGWARRPYSGPSPHTDHVHLSFFRQGKNRLPEDILGFGRSGRGYVMHRGEQVLRRNETTNNSSNVTHYHFAPNSVVLDASTITDLSDVVRLIKGLQATARANGVPGVRVT